MSMHIYLLCAKSCHAQEQAVVQSFTQFLMIFFKLYSVGKVKFNRPFSWLFALMYKEILLKQNLFNYENQLFYNKCP